MSFFKKTKNDIGPDFNIIVRDETIERLKTTCFRGKEKALAGNFSAWGDVWEMLRDEFILEELLYEMMYLSENNDFGDHSLEVTYRRCAVGWASTDTIINYGDDDLVVFHPNRKSCALKVSSVEFKAPETQRITFVFEMKEEGADVTMVIHSIYPGMDIGVLDGDITKREGVVFFDWSHPGQ